MPLKDPTEWFDDLTFHIEDDELLEQAEALEPTLIFSGSRILGAAWVVLVSAIGGLFAGFTFSPEVRASWPAFLAYLIGGALILRFIKPITTRLMGPSVAWQAMLAFFWSFLLATVVILGARIDTAWISYTVTVGGGLFIGLMYGSLNPGFVKQEDAWLAASLPLGALSAWASAALYRAMLASSAAWWGPPFVGLMAAWVLMIPMAALLAKLWDKSQGYARMATLYLHNDNFTAKAVEYLDRAIELSPRSADLYNLRGIAYSKGGDAARADADFKRVTELSPKAAEAHMNRGVDLLRQGLFDRAIEAQKLAIAISPKLATAHSNLGTAYQRKGDLDAAIESYSRALELRANYPIAFSNRAYSYFLKGDHVRSIADSRRAIELDPRLPMAYVNLAHAQAATGDSIAAAHSYRRALELEPDHTIAEEALNGLKKLGVRADAEETDDEGR
jgi:Flp pilus assembly protein TadD